MTAAIGAMRCGSPGCRAGRARHRVSASRRSSRSCKRIRRTHPPDRVASPGRRREKPRKGEYMHHGITRRDALRRGAAAGLGLSAFGATTEAVIAQALAASPKHGTLKDIEHVVIFIQENRSFDHYFGTLSGVRGYGDKHAHKVFLQKTLEGKTVAPWHLPTACLPDITHDWGPQHRSWNGGKMDGFVRSREPANVDGPAIAPETMGYYTRKDLG